MHKGVDWVSPDTPIAEIAKLMRAHDIGCIPIGEDDKLVSRLSGYYCLENKTRLERESAI